MSPCKIHMETTRIFNPFTALTGIRFVRTFLLMESNTAMFMLAPTGFAHHSGTEAGNQSIHKFLFLGAGCSNAKLFTGLLQHGDGQLSQGALLHVSPHLFFRHLRFGLLLGSSFIISYTIIEKAYTARRITQAVKCKFNST